MATTIMLETGTIERFAQVGNFASYARCVDSARYSNGKKKGEGNRKNGNRYLAWAFVEAAHFALRYNAAAKRFYEGKKAQTNAVVATTRDGTNVFLGRLQGRQGEWQPMPLRLILMGDWCDSMQPDE